jgi:hypothetical protein
MLTSRRLHRGTPSKSAAAAILLCAALLAPGPGVAKNIYKYQDENGIWHFTDRAPEEDVAFETVYMEREPEPRIRLRREGPKENPVYLLFNDFWGPVQVELRLVESQNVLAEPALPARFVIPGQEERVLVGLGPLDPRQGFRYRLSMNSVPGPPVGGPIDGITVRPPLPAGKQFLISQGFDDGKTHVNVENRYAVDIAMPVGTPVHAARAGTVMDIEEDFNSGGDDVDRYLDKANHVRILHDDGTMALYAHLDLASVSVRRGAKVRAGQQIARSGNTGFTSGPHLHFAIQQNTGMKLVSVPFRFSDASGATLTPRTGQIISGAAGPR